MADGIRVSFCDRKEARELRKEIVPVDLVSEQKIILGIVSMRQLFYVIVVGAIAYNLLGLIDVSGMELVIIAAIYTFILTPFAAFVYFFAFWKMEKYDMYLDYFLFLMFVYWKEKGTLRYRHGSVEKYEEPYE